jgi:acetylornithine/N-succinyldiaminopimelate aminotransferase
MNSKRQSFLKYVCPTSPEPMGLEIVSAKGIWLKDVQGKKYMDLISGISVSSLGHGNSAIKNAVFRQVRKHSHLMVFGEIIQHPQVQLAEATVSQLPEQLNSVYFVNSGSEAVEGAMKLAKKATGRAEIMSFRDAYHGSSQGALSLMGNDFFKSGYYPLLPSIRHMSFNSVSDLSKISRDTAAVIVEPIQGEAGAVPACFCFMKKLRERCSEVGALLIFDEIQSGCSRTGKRMAFEHYGIVPDVLLLAKAYGGGYPLGAFIADSKLMRCLSENPILGHITTFGGHPVSCAAALAAWKQFMHPDILNGVLVREAIFRSTLVHPLIKGMGGKGLLLSLNLGSREINFAAVRACIAKGILTDWFLFNDYSMRLAPPLTITIREVRKACRLILEALDEVQRGLS